MCESKSSIHQYIESSHHHETVSNELTNVIVKLVSFVHFLLEFREQGGLLGGNVVTLDQLSPDGSLLLDILLSGECGNGNHRQTAVVQLTGLHGVTLISVIGQETKGVEAELPGHVGVLHLVNLTGVIPGNRDTVAFADTDGEEEDFPELREDGLNGLETGERGGATDTVEQGMEFLSHKPAESGKHGNTAVGNLGLAVALGLRDGEGGGVGEADGVEETRGGGDAGEGEHVLLAGVGAVLGRDGLALCRVVGKGGGGWW